MAERAVIPPPPPGFVLDQDSIPPPPPGFTLDGAPPKSKLDAGVIPAVSLGETALSLGSGAAGAVAGGFSGLGTIATNAMGLTDTPPGDRVRQVQEAMTYQPRTYAGQKMTEAVSYPFEKLAQGADWAGGKVTDVTGSPTAGAAVNTAIQAVPAAIGKVLSPAARRAAVLERTRQEVRQKLAAPKDAAITDAKASGYTLSPAEANPTLLNRLLEGFSGQAKVQQLASSKNQPVTNAIVRKGLGIAPDEPLSLDALASVRKKQGEAYETVRQTGDVVIDAQYGAALDKIVDKYRGAAKSFPEEAGAVEKAVDSARNTVQAGKFDASAGVDKIKLERSRADKAFRQGDTDLGKAHKAIADAVEAQIERQLASAGPSKALNDFRHAREVIARSYDVQKALKGNDVDARVLGAQLRKGRPMGGGLDKAAEFGARFKGAAETGGKNAYVPVSYFDALGGGMAGAGALFHGPEVGVAAATALGVTALRPAIRAGITSGPYQRLGVNPPSYGLGTTRRLAELMTSDPSLAAGLLMQGQQQ